MAQVGRAAHPPMRLDVACPRCGRATIVALFLVNERDEHQHTLYHCIFYRSGGRSACMWSGWIVPEASRHDESSPDVSSQPSPVSQRPLGPEA